MAEPKYFMAEPMNSYRGLSLGELGVKILANAAIGGLLARTCTHLTFTAGAAIGGMILPSVILTGRALSILKEDHNYFWGILSWTVGLTAPIPLSNYVFHVIDLPEVPIWTAFSITVGIAWIDLMIMSCLQAIDHLRQRSHAANPT